MVVTIPPEQPVLQWGRSLRCSFLAFAQNVFTSCLLPYRDSWEFFGQA